MDLKIDQKEVEGAIKSHLDTVVKEGLSYEVKKKLEEAIANAITPEVIQGYVESAMRALTDPAVTQRISNEMQKAFATAVQLTMQESFVAVVARLQGIFPNNRLSSDYDGKLSEIRNRLFPQGI